MNIKSVLELLSKLLPYLLGENFGPCPYTPKWLIWYPRSYYVCILIRYTIGMVSSDILPLANWDLPSSPHTNFSILCAHFEDISSCDEESFMHEDALDEDDVAFLVTNILLQDTHTTSDTSEIILDEDSLDGFSSFSWSRTLWMLLTFMRSSYLYFMFLHVLPISSILRTLLW